MTRTVGTRQETQCGTLGLAAFTFLFVAVLGWGYAFAEPGSPKPEPVRYELTLQPTQEVHGGAFTYLENLEVFFTKEPGYVGRKVVRRALPIGPEKQDFIGLAWDREGQKLYLDLNCNLDLTDDPDGVYETTGSRGVLEANDVRIEVRREEAPVFYRVWLHITGEDRVGFAARSGWMADLKIDNETYVLAIADNLDGRLDAQDSLVFHTALQAGSRGGTPLPEKLFAGGRAFRLALAFGCEDQTTVVKAVLTETEASYGELHLIGEGITLLSLAGTCAVTLDHPEPLIKLPVGPYTIEFLELEAHSHRSYVRETFTIQESVPTSLKMGGPLVRKVTATQQGRLMTLVHELQDGDGRVYIARERGQEPGFATYRGDQKLASGVFEYG